MFVNIRITFNVESGNKIIENIISAKYKSIYHILMAVMIFFILINSTEFNIHDEEQMKACEFKSRK